MSGPDLLAALAAVAQRWEDSAARHALNAAENRDSNLLVASYSQGMADAETGGVMKTRLTSADRNKVWRAANSWVHYYFDPDDGYWWCSPIDPRKSPGLTNRFRAHGATPDGTLTHTCGFVEANDGRN